MVCINIFSKNFKIMKKFNFYVLIAIIIFVTINLLSVTTIYIITNKNYFNKEEYISFKKRFRKTDEKTVYPHPFFGFNHTYLKPAKNKISLNEQLYSHIPNDITEKDIKILILGGSVAEDFSKNDDNSKFKINKLEINDKNIFQKVLNDKFKTNRFKVYNASIGGGKQPQQLFKLYYLYLINEKFDIVINIDGFNEVALSFSENIQIENNIIYPRNYSRLISTFNSDLSCVKKSNKYTKEYSLIPIVEIYKLFQIRKCHIKSEGSPTEKNSRFSKMSNFVKLDDDIYFDYIKKLWLNSSNEIDQFSNIKNFKYIHIIQPNQYLKGSKIISNDELDFLKYEKYGKPISKYYKDIQVEDLDVKYKLDLRYIFKDNDMTLYRDYCCHLNNKGIFLMATEIVDQFSNLFKEILDKDI